MSSTDTDHDEPEECPICGADIVQSRTDDDTKDPIYDARADGRVYGCNGDPTHTVTDNGLAWSPRHDEFVDVEEFDAAAEDMMAEAIAAEMADTTVSDLGGEGR